ncbi:MAG: fibronectin type III domain-containing protein [Planctomycetota bacterium]
MKTLGVNKLIATYPERVILFGCIVTLIIVFFTYILGKKEDSMMIIIKENIVQLKKSIEKNEPKALPEMNYRKKIKNNWEYMPLLAEGKSWLMYRQPVVAVRFEKTILQKILKRNFPPTIKNIQNIKEPYKVILNWDGNKDSTAQIKSYRVYRQSQEEENFNLIIELPATALTSADSGYIYLDKELKSETEYSYYMTAFSDDQDMDKQESERSNCVKIITLADYDIEFKSVENDFVYTKIMKYLNGQWENQLYNTKKGDKIGKDKFSTECIIVDIQPYEIDGKEIGPGQVTKIKTFKIIYLDKNKKEHNYIIKP